MTMNGSHGVPRVGEVAGQRSAMTRRGLVARGIAWNTAYQAVEALLALGTMLVLVRIIPPAEYGRVGAVVGLLTVLNAVGIVTFLNQALQLPEGEKPDWALHWSVGFYLQTSLMLACHGLAGLCWLSPHYRPMAPLLHLAAFGLLVDWPAQLRGAMLRREMDFPRLRILSACSAALRCGVTLVVGLGGGGAYAIVLGANVLPSLPLAVDLLAVRRWRPEGGWWHWPAWPRYRPALRFGFQQAGSALLSSARGAFEAAVLPATVGYGGIGLLTRAQALFSMSVGRLGNVVIESVYPVLPRYAAEPLRYGRPAVLFVQGLSLLALPSAIFVGLQGPMLSRVLYGEKWIAADPLILPAALIGLGQILFVGAYYVLLAANRLRTCLALDVVVASLLVSTVSIAWAGYGLVAYAWALAAAQMLAASVALGTVSALFAPGWALSILGPPGVSAAAATALLLAVRGLWAAEPLALQLAVDSALYFLAVVFVLRGVFPGPLAQMLRGLPGGSRVLGWIGLLPAPRAAAQ